MFKKCPAVYMYSEAELLDHMVCIYVCVYVCMHVCVYVYMHVCLYVCMYVSVYLHSLYRSRMCGA